MKLWQSLYALIWLNFFALLSGTLYVIPYKTYVHSLLGLAVLALAFRNKATLAQSKAPARLRRISAATATLSVVAAVTGLMLAISSLHFLSTLWMVLHIMAVAAIVAQSGSVATAYDMWEEKEYEPAP